MTIQAYLFAILFLFFFVLAFSAIGVIRAQIKVIAVIEQKKAILGMENVELRANYAASETGVREIEESYQQEILTLNEQLERKNQALGHMSNDLKTTTKISLFHDEYCLPNLALRLSQDEKNTLEMLRG